MAEFYAYRIIDGKYKYKNVPKSLKTKVKTILVEEGFESLIEE